MSEPRERILVGGRRLGRSAAMRGAAEALGMKLQTHPLVPDDKAYVIDPSQMRDPSGLANIVDDTNGNLLGADPQRGSFWRSVDEARALDWDDVRIHSLTHRAMMGWIAPNAAARLSGLTGDAGPPSGAITGALRDNRDLEAVLRYVAANLLPGAQATSHWDPARDWFWIGLHVPWVDKWLGWFYSPLKAHAALRGEEVALGTGTDAFARLVGEKLDECIAAWRAKFAEVTTTATFPC